MSGLSRADAIGCVEAAYRFDTDENWVQGVTEALFRALEPDHGVGGYLFQKHPGRVEMRCPAFRNLNPGYLATRERATQIHTDHVYPLAPQCISAVHQAQRLGLKDYNKGGELFGPHPNVFVIYASNLAGTGAAFTLPQANQRKIHPKLEGTLLNLSVHVAAADRLRHKYGRVTVDGAAAVFTPAGKLLDAKPEAREGDQLEELASEVAEQDRARGRMRRESPTEALAAWKGLVRGRWSLVEVIESDQKRFLVAVENSHGVPDPRALTHREAEVCFFAANGHANCLIGYELGVKTSTVGTHLKSALRKLKLKGRTELVRIGPEAFLNEEESLQPALP